MWEVFSITHQAVSSFHKEVKKYTSATGPSSSIFWPGVVIVRSNFMVAQLPGSGP
jgi:hypothetical protein